MTGRERERERLREGENILRNVVALKTAGVKLQLTRDSLWPAPNAKRVTGAAVSFFRYYTAAISSKLHCAAPPAHRADPMLSENREGHRP